jgi:hypothetical protein
VIAQSQGPNSAGTGINIIVTSVPWLSPGSIVSSNNIYANASITFLISATDALVATNFGFSIPGTATIDGILVSIEKSRTAGFALMFDIAAQLTKDGTNPIGNNQPDANPWPTSDTYFNYGNATDLWGTTREIDNDYFTLEKSANGLNYFELATIQ